MASNETDTMSMRKDTLQGTGFFAQKGRGDADFVHQGAYKSWDREMQSFSALRPIGYGVVALMQTV